MPLANFCVMQLAGKCLSRPKSCMFTVAEKDRLV